jgi:hypothetical protein
MSPALPKSRLSTVATSPKRIRVALCTGLISILLSACGGGEPEADLRREPLAAGTTAKAASYDPNDLYRFFAVSFGAAPGVTYMGQLREAADAGMSIQQIVNVFTTKAQFLETYPANLTAQEFAQRLVDNVVGTSATASAKAEARGQVEAALASGMTRGDITFAIFNNLARKPANDPQWAGTARKMADDFFSKFAEAVGGPNVVADAALPVSDPQAAPATAGASETAPTNASAPAAPHVKPASGTAPTAPPPSASMLGGVPQPVWIAVVVAAVAVALWAVF